MAAKNLPLALACFQRALAEQPRDALANASLGQALCWDERPAEGLPFLREAGRLLLKSAQKSGNPAEALQLCDQLIYWRDFAAAADLCRKIAKNHPREARAFQLLALAELRQNHATQALHAARQAQRLLPRSALLNILLASLEAANGLRQEARQRLEAWEQEPGLSVEEYFRIHRELAALYDKQGAYDQVFPQLRAAAGLAPALPALKGMDKTLVPRRLTAQQNEIDPELLNRWRGAEFPANCPAPVFLMGFMRTGTTLTQQVLAAHGDIIVADEPDILAKTGDELHRLHPGLPRAQQLQMLTWPQVLELREYYWRNAETRFGAEIRAKRFIDKTTMNSMELDVLNVIFPDAKILFLVRDPRDVTLSCFMQIMAPTPMTVQIYNWNDAAQFYALVMQGWLKFKPLMPAASLEIRYESAVLEFENTFKQVFDFLGLTWQAQVAAFHENRSGRAINSPSFQQVTQPLYASSLGRWRHYAAEFASVAEYLQPFIDYYHY